MDNPIIEIEPKVLEYLKEVAVQRKLIPFIGSGASIIAGYPSWDGFADGLIQKLIDLELMTHAQFDQIKNQPPRVKLSMARSIQEKSGKNISYDSLFKATSPEKKAKGEKLYSLISQLSNVFITTNYDSWLDNIILPIPLQNEESVESSSGDVSGVYGNSRNVFYLPKD
ncbi:MAG: hypothetical protein JNL74_20690, partial [Fibrobacteres bacterium]|nr:hypothetical protein [Fibrobacterota bacterium]